MTKEEKDAIERNIKELEYLITCIRTEVAKEKINALYARQKCHLLKMQVMCVEAYL